MDNIQLERFSKEIEIIERILNGYLATDPILSDFVLDSLSIRPKEETDIEEVFGADNAKNIQKKDQYGTDPELSPKKARCCVRPSGKRYMWHGSGPCPNRDKEC